MFLVIKLICAIICTISGGFVISKLWLWFVVPLGLLPISLPQAIGIDLIVTYMVKDLSENTTTSNEEKYKKMITLLICPWLVLLIGWIVSLFM